MAEREAEKSMMDIIEKKNRKLLLTIFTFLIILSTLKRIINAPNVLIEVHEGLLGSTILHRGGLT